MEQSIHPAIATTNDARTMHRKSSQRPSPGYKRRINGGPTAERRDGRDFAAYSIPMQALTQASRIPMVRKYIMRSVCEEAAMAAITFSTFQKEQMRRRLKAAVIALRKLPHAFASNWMRRAAAKVEHARRLPASRHRE
jgi:hypothetical protein